METVTKTKWIIDTAHSEIGFKVKHLMITNVKGSFREYESSIVTTGDDFTTAEIHGEPIHFVECNIDPNRFFYYIFYMLKGYIFHIRKFFRHGTQYTIIAVSFHREEAHKIFISGRNDQLVITKFPGEICISYKKFIFIGATFKF